MDLELSYLPPRSKENNQLVGNRIQSLGQDGDSIAKQFTMIVLRKHPNSHWDNGEYNDVSICKVLVHLCCYIKVPQMEYHLNNRNLVLTILEAVSSKSVCRHGRVRVLFQVGDFSLSLTWQKGQSSSLGPLSPEN